MLWGQLQDLSQLVAEGRELYKNGTEGTCVMHKYIPIVINNLIYFVFFWSL